MPAPASHVLWQTILLVALLALTACSGDGAPVERAPHQRPTPTPPVLGWLALDPLPAAVAPGHAAHALVIDRNGLPVIAWETAAGSTRVHRWSGSEWLPLGAGIADARRPALTLDAFGQPYLVYWRPNRDGTRWQAFAARWTGVDWQGLGSALATLHLPAGASATEPRAALALDALGNPLVALAAGAPPAQLRVWRWSGMEWIAESLALNADPGRHASAPRLAAGADLLLSWVETPLAQGGAPTAMARAFTARRSGGYWEQLGGIGSAEAQVWDAALAATYQSPLLALQSIGDPLQIAEYAGGAWFDRGSFPGARQPAIAVRDLNDFYLAVTEHGVPQQVQLLRWVGGTDWRTEGRPLPGQHPSLAVTPDRVYVATQTGMGTLQVFQRTADF